MDGDGTGVGSEEPPEGVVGDGFVGEVGPPPGVAPLLKVGTGVRGMPPISFGLGPGTPNAPIPRATLTRRRLTIPSATTRRARWADVTWFWALLSGRHARGRLRTGW
jgi:hypothetical protein